MNNVIKKFNNQRGVSLIIVFFVMTIMIVIVLSISTILLNEIGIIQDIGNSVSAFYLADLGIEKTLYYDQNVIPSGGTRGFCNICDACSTNNSDENINCNNCSLVGTDCNPLSCNNCQLTLGSPAENQTNQLTASVVPNDPDPSISYLSVLSYGYYKTATRQMSFNTTSNITYTPPPPPPPPTNCLTAYWKLDEDPTTPGFSIYDSSGNDHWGTPHGPFGTNNLPQPSTDVAFGFPPGSRSLSFDGTDDRVDFGNSPLLNPSSAISVAFWIKTDELSYGSFGSDGWHIYIEPYASKIEWITYDGSNSIDDLLASINLADGSWHQVTFIWKSGTDEKKIYVDGVQVALGTHSITLNAENSNVDFKFGRSGALGQTSNALMDDVRIYGCALGQSDIQALQIPGSDINPVFDNGGGVE